MTPVLPIADNFPLAGAAADSRRRNAPFVASATFPFANTVSTLSSTKETRSSKVVMRKSPIWAKLSVLGWLRVSWAR